MTSIFNVPEKVPVYRWISIVLGFLPPIMIFGAGFVWPMDKDGSAKIQGRPAGGVFGLVWTVLTALWVCAIFVASIHFSTLSLTLTQFFSNCALVLSIVWLYLYNDQKQKSAAAQTLLLNTLFAFLIVVTGATAETQNPRASQAVSLMIAPLFVWLGCASMFNYLEINLPTSGDPSENTVGSTATGGV